MKKSLTRYSIHTLLLILLVLATCTKNRNPLVRDNKYDPGGSTYREIALDKTSLTPACGLGSDAAASGFSIWNTKTTDLNYTINDDAAWLSCSPTSGSSNGEHDAITVDYTTSGVTSGTHTATITINGTGATNTPQTISATLTVGSPAWQPGDSLVDSRDGQKYATVVIGTQCWMAENLNIGVYKASVNTGSSHSDVSDNGIIEKYAYNNDTTNFATYGGLYDWNEAMGYSTTEGVQGICPNGWHIPTDAEWTTLVNEVGGSSTGGTALKEGGSSGFQALLSGLPREIEQKKTYLTG